MITGRQLKAARAMARWSIEELAKRTDLSVSGLKKIERDDAKPQAATIEAITNALDAAGIQLIDGEGVRPKDKTLKIIEGNDAYLRLLDDVYYTMKDGGEVLFAFVRNKLSSPAVIEKDLGMRHLGITFRSLIEEGDDYCLYPLEEYRCVPSKFFQNNVQIIYGNKVGSMASTPEIKRAFIVENEAFAETQRNVFEMAWETHKPPTKTSATKVYT